MSDTDRKFIEGIARVLDTPVNARPGFDERVMAAVRAEPAHRAQAPVRSLKPASRGFAQWMLSPKSFRMSPLAAFAAAAGLLIAFGVASRSSSEAALSPLAAASAPAARSDSVLLVQFVLVAPNAQKVALVGDFNDWNADATLLATEGEQGVWTVSVPLRPGNHQYGFVINGTEWRTDPNAPQAVDDSYGTPNSVVTVSAAS